MFGDGLILEIMKIKKRINVYDIRNEDFNRLVTLNKTKKPSAQNSSEQEFEDELLEEIGDIDPKQILAIN
jgi:adenylyl- and sulfurtransferase ThiI